MMFNIASTVIMAARWLGYFSRSSQPLIYESAACSCRYLRVPWMSSSGAGFARVSLKGQAVPWAGIEHRGRYRYRGRDRGRDQSCVEPEAAGLMLRHQFESRCHAFRGKPKPRLSGRVDYLAHQRLFSSSRLHSSQGKSRGFRPHPLNRC